MKLTPTNPNELAQDHRRAGGFTLAEVAMAAAIALLTVTGIIYGYTQSIQRAEWSGFSLAAHAAATQRLEQTRACRWDTAAGVDQLVAANFPQQVVLLDLPVVGTNALYGTNITTITTISAAAPQLRMIRVECCWHFPITGRSFTNVVVTYRSPDA